MSIEMDITIKVVGVFIVAMVITCGIGILVKPEQAKGWLKTGAFFILLFAGFGFYIIKSSGNTSNSAGQGNKPDNKVVWVAAEDYVRTQLLNPSGAKFCSYSEATISYTEKTGIYTIKGWVDSTNAYGATVRSNFACNLELTGNGYKNASAIFY